MRWRWRAYYGDTRIDEKTTPYPQLDRTKLTAFSLVSRKREVILYVQPTQKLFYRQRTLKKINANPSSPNVVLLFNEPADERKLWLMGTHELVGGKVVRRIVFVDEDGVIEVFSDFQKVEPYTQPDFSVEEAL